MNLKERDRTTLIHKEPDEVPINLEGEQSGISYGSHIPEKIYTTSK